MLNTIRHRNRTLSAALVLAAIWLLPTKAGLAQTRPADNSNRALVVLEVVHSDGHVKFGGGVLVSDDGYFITNRHTVASSEHGSVVITAALVYTFNGTIISFHPLQNEGYVTRTVEVLSIAPEFDLALGKINIPGDQLPAPFLRPSADGMDFRTAVQELVGRNVEFAGVNVTESTVAGTEADHIVIASGSGTVAIAPMMPSASHPGGLRRAPYETALALPWMLHTNRFAGNPEGFSGGPMVIDGELAAINQGYSSYGANSTNLHAVPIEFARIAFGLGEPRFSSEHGYRPPSDLAELFTSGDVFARRRAEFLLAMLREHRIVGPRHFAETIGFLTHYSSFFPPAAEAMPFAVDEYAELFPGVVPDVEQMLLSASDEVLRIDWSQYPQFYPNREANIELVARGLVTTFFSDPEGIVCRHASRSRPVIILMPTYTAGEKAFVARLVGEHGISVGLQFGRGSDVIITNSSPEMHVRYLALDAESLGFTDFTNEDVRFTAAMLIALRKKLSALEDAGDPQYREGLLTSLDHVLRSMLLMPEAHEAFPQLTSFTFEGERMPAELDASLAVQLSTSHDGRRIVRTVPRDISQLMESGLLNGMPIINGELTSGGVRQAIATANHIVMRYGRAPVGTELMLAVETMRF